jgi:hypothetical protein
MLLDHPSDEPTAIRTYIAAIQLCCARARKLDCFVASAPRKKMGLGKTPATTKLSSPGEPGDDSGVCCIHQGGPQGRCRTCNDVVTFRFNFQTADKRSHSRGTILPELCVSLSLKHEGAGNAGCALHPRSRVQNG